MHLKISLKATRNILMFNVKEGEKIEYKKVIKLQKVPMETHLKMH